MPKAPNTATRSRRARTATGRSAPSGAPVVPVVAIGASAGGLEALEQFLAALPTDTGQAFVVLQHLDPTQRSALPELLQRATPLPVREIRQRLPVLRDHVYVAPPGKSVSLLDGRLMLGRPRAARGLTLAIDDLFVSLAAALGPEATGVLLSGMGHDGTRGLAAIRDAAGRTLAQLPSSAAFDEMPRSAIDAGVVDVVAPADELPARLLRAAGADPAQERDAGVLRAILGRLRDATGQDFTEYKEATVRRRVALRMAHQKANSLQDYLLLLEREPAELSELAKAMLIGVTSMFRDPAAWEQLEREALPALLASLAPGAVLRAWVPACSTGEEAYTLAIALLEALERIDVARRPSLRIFATDIDPVAIETARQGLYPQRIAAELPTTRLRRYFTSESTRFRVRKFVRELIVFATHDIISDPPFTRVDLLSCRNLLIYMTPDLQQRLAKLFHYSLRPGGVLLLGAAETLGPRPRGFRPIDVTHRIYRRSDTAPGTRQLATTRAASRPSTAPALHPRSAHRGEPASTAEQALLRLYAPAGVLVDDDGEIVHWLGSTAKYLDAPTGRRHPGVLGVAKPRLKRAVAELLAAVPRGRHGEISRQVATARGARTTIRITAKRLLAPASLRGLVMVAFEDVRAVALPPGRAAGVKALRAALTLAQEEAAASRREALRSRDQLGAANQELQSMNEELQSANEELTTSKEETQSMNEELQTVNAELQSKLASLSLVNDDLRNLLESTDIAIVFLDPRLNVRRFTRPVANIVRLIAADVGRPFGDIRTDLDYPQFEQDIRAVLQDLAPRENEVGAVDGRWYRVRIMPYQTIEGVGDGVVITFTDVSAAKRLEAELRKLRGGADV